MKEIQKMFLGSDGLIAQTIEDRYYVLRYTKSDNFRVGDDNLIVKEVPNQKICRINQAQRS